MLFWITINAGDLISDHFNLNLTTCVWGPMHVYFESSSFFFCRPCVESTHSMLATSDLQRGVWGALLQVIVGAHVVHASVKSFVPANYGSEQLQDFFFLLLCGMTSFPLSGDICSHISSCLADVDNGLWSENTCLEFGQVSVLVCRFWCTVVDSRICPSQVVFSNFLSAL